MIKKIGLLLVIVLVFSSCASRKKMAYFQNIAEVSSDRLYETTLQPDDELQIIVNAPPPNQELAAPFNMTTLTPLEGGGTASTTEGRTYLLDNKGEIVMPLVGKIKLSGLTHEEALKKLNDEVSKYIINPIVSFKIINFKVTVIGDVGRPGSIPVTGERITLPEAIAQAGDLSIYGIRTNIMVIREVDGKKTYNYVDFTKADFMNSEYYYLAQNDLVVVEPNKVKRNSSALGREITIAVSVIGVLLSVITIATR